MFDPWIGQRFGEKGNRVGGKRLLILGESHRSERHEVGSHQPQMTQDVVKAYLDGSLDRTAKGFFTRLATLIANKPGWALANDERRGIWGSVAFYNYVPRLAVAKARERPADDLFAEGELPFFEILRQLEIEACLVCGDELWRHMPQGEPGADTLVLNDEIRGTRLYLALGRDAKPAPKVRAAHMRHPASFGWRYETWRPVLEHLLRASDHDTPAND